MVNLISERAGFLKFHIEFILGLVNDGLDGIVLINIKFPPDDTNLLVKRR